MAPASKCQYHQLISAGIAVLALRLSVLPATSATATNQKATFAFPEFPYKETNKNEMAYREFEAACEQNPTCALQKALARLKCVRECISPVCYQQIYYQDQLEDGEIDVRLNSFKGCFAQRTGRQR